MKERNNYIDILKGIGILSVVIGHAFYVTAQENEFVQMLKDFVYIYHLVIFFWISGMLYKTKCIRDFFKKTLNNYKKYVLIALISYAFLPLWYYLQVIDVYSFHEIIYQFAHIIIFQVTRGIFTGPMWFVTCLVVAQTLYYFVDRVLQNKRILFKGGVYTILGIIGIIMGYKGILTHYYYLDRAFLVQPFLFLGNMCKKKKMSTKLSLIIAPLSAILIVTLNRVTGLHVELSHSELYGYWLFYPITILGIVFCLSLSVLIEKVRIAKSVEFLGKNSDVVMATHVMGFKLLDGIIGKIQGNISIEVLHGYPTAFNGILFCCLYTAVGIALPIIFVGVKKFVKTKTLKAS